MINADLAAFHQKFVDRSQNNNAYREVFWILQHCLGVSWADIHIKRLSDFNQEDIKTLNRCLEEYLAGKPLAYILGSVPFYGLDLTIEEGVLIPRVDSECLVDAVLSFVAPGDRVLELGVGSGAVSCALAINAPDVCLVAIDKSKQALAVAGKNIKDLSLSSQIQLIDADWYQPLDLGKFDCVVANPPYIANDDKDIDSAVQQYEPQEALIAEQEGFADLLHILILGKQLLKLGGYLVLEHGYQQQELLIKHLKEASYCQITRGHDGENPRYVVARRG